MSKTSTSSPKWASAVDYVSGWPCPYTMGPWFVSHKDHRKVYGENWQDIAYTHDRKYTHQDTAEADARLISAAPELLEACQILMDAHSAGIGSEFSDELLIKAIDKANSAIVKAGIGAKSKAKSFKPFVQKRA